MAEAVLSSERTLFWKPLRFITSALALIAGAGTLIANIDTITAVFEPSLSGAWVLTLSNKNSAMKTYEGLNFTYQVYLVQDANHVTGRGKKPRLTAKTSPRDSTSKSTLRARFRAAWSRSALSRRQARMVSHGRPTGTSV